MDCCIVAHMSKVKKQLNRLSISLKEENISWQEVVVKEKDLEDGIGAEETDIIRIENPTSTEVIG